MAHLRNAARKAALAVPPISRLVAHRDQLAENLQIAHEELRAAQQIVSHQTAELSRLRSQISGLTIEWENAKRSTDNVQQELPAPKTKNRPSVLDLHSSSYPSHEAALKLFEGTWSSHIPGYGFGPIELFDDHRIKWLAQQCAGLYGKKILELGPLEGGHTSMLAGMGAKVTSIESNSISYLKCLTVKNILKFDAEFLYGDFRKYLNETNERFDIVVASGVLYHMTDPITLLDQISMITDSILLWTHYYDGDIISASPLISHKFAMEPTFMEARGRKWEMRKQCYLEALEWGGFSGGAEQYSYWLTRSTLIGYLEDLGFSLSVTGESSTHPHGPALTIFASREQASQSG